MTIINSLSICVICLSFIQIGILYMPSLLGVIIFILFVMVLLVSMSPDFRDYWKPEFTVGNGMQNN